MPPPPHLDWLVDTGERLKTADGHDIEVWELQHADDPAVLSAWAKHFREHYCDDDMLEKLVAGTGKTNGEYLVEMKFPDAKEAPGPRERSPGEHSDTRDLTLKRQPRVSLRSPGLLADETTMELVAEEMEAVNRDMKRVLEDATQAR